MTGIIRKTPLALRLGMGGTALCLALAAAAQTGPATQGGTAAGQGAGSERAGRAASQLSRADTAFMKQAAENNHAEIESSKLAMQKASDPAVKGFAQQMVADHGKTGQELAALASAKGVELPDGPSLMQKAKLKLLEAADGADFDRRYAETMGLAAHRDTIALFQKAAKEARDPEVKAFAAKTLPALQGHLDMAQKLPAAHDAGKGHGKR